MAGGDKGFLSRWSRLKREGERAPSDETPAQAEAARPGPGEEDSDAAGKSLEEVRRELDLPDIESLDKESDYSAFLKEEVPDALRNMALRKLWLSDPVLANLDGLNDYDENFALAMEKGAEAMRKAYRAGKQALEKGEETAAAADDGEAEDGPDAVEAAAAAPDEPAPETDKG